MADKKCTAVVAAGRLKKAREFRLAAELVEAGALGQNELNDAYITMCVHAGIAAADVICCRRLNVHHQGDNHDEAITALARVDRNLATDLGVLLRKKTSSGYTERTSSAPDRAPGSARLARGRIKDGGINEHRTAKIGTFELRPYLED